MYKLLNARHRGRIIERAYRSEIFRIELLPGAAFQACPVGHPLIRERAAQVFMPTAKDGTKKSDLFAKGTVGSVY